MLVGLRRRFVGRCLTFHSAGAVLPECRFCVLFDCWCLPAIVPHFCLLDLSIGVLSNAVFIPFSNLFLMSLVSFHFLSKFCSVHGFPTWVLPFLRVCVVFRSLPQPHSHLPRANRCPAARCGIRTEAATGAWELQKTRLQTSGVTRLQSAAIVTEAGYDRTPEGISMVLERLRGALLQNTQSV